MIDLENNRLVPMVKKVTIVACPTCYATFKVMQVIDDSERSSHFYVQQSALLNKIYNKEPLYLRDRSPFVGNILPFNQEFSNNSNKEQLELIRKLIWISEKDMYLDITIKPNGHAVWFSQIYLFEIARGEHAKEGFSLVEIY